MDAAVSGDRSVLQREHAYPAWVALVQHAENISWTRFYNFLVFATILVLAWATIYSQASRPWGAAVVMAVMSGVGLLSGFIWAGLGYRSRQYLHFYLKGGAKLEEGAEAECQVCKGTMDFGRKLPVLGRVVNTPLFGSGFLLLIVPLAFVVLYFVLLAVSVKLAVWP
jgi:hypothetical protein